MVTLSKIIEGLEMVDDIVDCYYNPEKDEIFLSNIGEYEELSEDEIDEVLRLARNKFENLGYRVYFTGAKYNYQGENRIVESNEYLVAIKGL